MVPQVRILFSPPNIDGVSSLIKCLCLHKFINVIIISHMIKSWEQLDAALASNEPLPLISIHRPSSYRHPLLGPEPADGQTPQEPLLDIPILRNVLQDLARSLQGKAQGPTVLEALIHETPQTIGSLAAATSLSIELADEKVRELQEAGIVQLFAEDGLERAALLIPVT
jgi:hypothetical protein